MTDPIDAAARLGDIHRMMLSGINGKGNRPSLHIFINHFGHFILLDEDTDGDTYHGEGETLRAAIDAARRGEK